MLLEFILNYVCSTAVATWVSCVSRSIPLAILMRVMKRIGAIKLIFIACSPLGNRKDRDSVWPYWPSTRFSLAGACGGCSLVAQPGSCPIHFQHNLSHVPVGFCFEIGAPTGDNNAFCGLSMAFSNYPAFQISLVYTWISSLTLWNKHIDIGAVTRADNKWNMFWLSVAERARLKLRNW